MTVVKELAKVLAALTATALTIAAAYFVCFGFVMLLDDARASASAIVVRKVEQVATNLGYVRPVAETRASRKELILSAAQAYNVDPLDLLALVAQESGGNSFAVSEVNALGLLQIMPATAKQCGYKTATEAIEDRNNIDCGAWRFSQALKEEKGNRARAYQNYFGGHRCVDSAFCPKTLQYSKSVNSKRVQIESTLKMIG